MIVSSRGWHKAMCEKNKQTLEPPLDKHPPNAVSVILKNCMHDNIVIIIKQI